MKNIGLVGFLGLVCTVGASAAVTVDIGQIQLFSNTPVEGNQSIQLFNYTGANCDPVTYQVCNGAGINITNWTLTVQFADTTTATFGPNTTDPIAPYAGGAGFNGTVGAPWQFTETCATVCPPFTPQISSITFAGSVSDPNPVLYDGSTFFGASTFSVTYVPTVLFAISDSYVIYNPAEILVDAATPVGPSAVPEPSSFSLIILGAGAVLLSGLFRLGHRAVTAANKK